MKSRKIWIGRWLIGVALGHTLVGLMMGGSGLVKIAQQGLFNTVTAAEPLTRMVVWFLFCGAVLALLGMAVHALERSEHFGGARALGIGTALVTLTGLILMPLSGFWLVIPPAIALMRRTD